MIPYAHPHIAATLGTLNTERDLRPPRARRPVRRWPPPEPSLRAEEVAVRVPRTHWWSHLHRPVHLAP